MVQMHACHCKVNLTCVCDCRRQGIARHLLRACEDISLIAGVEDLALHAVQADDAAISLYRRAGSVPHAFAPWPRPAPMPRLWGAGHRAVRFTGLLTLLTCRRFAFLIMWHGQDRICFHAHAGAVLRYPRRHWLRSRFD